MRNGLLLTVGDFCDQVERDRRGLVDTLVAWTERNSPKEREAWKQSLPSLSRVLALAGSKHHAFGMSHILLGELALEYRLPSASAWCDVVLLGRSSHRIPQVMILELKNWDTRGDVPGEFPGLMNRHGQTDLHPSDQVQGYAEYCQSCHSAVIGRKADVSGCVYFTRDTPVEAYYKNPSADLAMNYPLFSESRGRKGTEALSDHILSRIGAPDRTFAEEFVEGTYTQRKDILLQVATMLGESSARPFVLLDNQRKGFRLAFQSVEKAVRNDTKRQVVIITGPPGSGKSAIAAKLWVEVAKKNYEKGNVAFVTTSSSQKTNWRHVFEAAGGGRSASFMIMPANQFNPGLTGAIVRKLKDRGYDMDAQDWRENLRSYRKEKGIRQRPESEFFVSIVDEAHALINPEGHRIGFASGWTLQAGPQAYHIIKKSKVSVFLLDARQAYRDNETTTVDDILRYAREFGATTQELDLSGCQFRCGGSEEYVKWVEALLEVGRAPTTVRWRKTTEVSSGPFAFDILDSPFELDRRLQGLHRAGKTVRLVSSYSVPWKTKKISNVKRLHALPDGKLDFHLRVGKGGAKYWSRPWNFAPGEDYTLFIQGAPGSAIAKNPLAEVGCPYVVRGFDFDYLGVVWLEDLIWRDGHWKVQFDHVHETALSNSLARARNGMSGWGDKVEERIKLGYRILLTRSISGVYLYVHDPETRAHIEEMLK